MLSLGKDAKACLMALSIALSLPVSPIQAAPAEKKEFFVRVRDHNEGPYTRREVDRLYEDGEIDALTYIWGENLPTWVQVGETRIVSDKSIQKALANRNRKPASVPTPPAFSPDAENQRETKDQYHSPASTTKIQGYFRAGGGVQGGLTYPYDAQFTMGGELGVSLAPGADLGLNLSTFSYTDSYSGFSASKTQISLSYTGGRGPVYFGGRFGVQLVGLSYLGDSYTSPPYFMTAPVLGFRIPIGGGAVRERVSLDLEASTIGAFTETFTLDFQSLGALRIRF